MSTAYFNFDSNVLRHACESDISQSLNNDKISFLANLQSYFSPSFLNILFWHRRKTQPDIFYMLISLVQGLVLVEIS